MKSVNIKEVVNALERFAPLPLQEGFDNAGLQVGLTETQEVSGALLCLDVTEKVVDEAVALGCNLIVSHHPLLFHALKKITGKDDVQRAVVKAIGFIYRNEGVKQQMTEAVRSVDEIERLTGIDFFPALDDQTEARVEASSDLSEW